MERILICYNVKQDKRQEAAEQAIASLGGTLEAYYFAFGDNDFYAVVDLPDNVSAAATSMVGHASGTLKTKTVVLLTPEEVDRAVRKTVEYRPPGQ
jgi:uncharacterized protein with GYD domain